MSVGERAVASFIPKSRNACNPIVEVLKTYAGKVTIAANQ
jgi:hypothetical protein